MVIQNLKGGYGSIDMGAMEVVNTFEELQSYCMIGSPFSIPKAALALAGLFRLFQKRLILRWRNSCRHSAQV